MDSNNHVHVFKDTVVPATCKENGYTLHRCDCGYEHKDNFTQLAPHNFKVVEETLPTCEHGGSRTICCAVCGETRNEAFAPMGHSFGPWKIQDFPTCVEEGKQIRICSRCGYKEESLLPATGHKLTSPKKSATQKGYKDYFCENCGQTVSVQSAFQKHKKKIIAAIISVVLLACLCAAAFLYLIPAIHYYRAIDYIDEGNYTEAYYSLKECDGFKDSRELLADFEYVYEDLEETRYLSFGTYTYKTEYEYDERGNEILCVEYDEDGNVRFRDEYKYEYDKNGNMTLWVWYDEDGNITDKVEYEYDENGNETLHVVYDEDGNITYREKCKYEYDENGNATLCIYYDKDGNIISKYKYEYDEHGNETLSVRYDKDGNITDKYEYEYDENGNETLYAKYTDGIMIHKEETKYKYDKNGNITQYIKNDEYGNIIDKAEYEFDDDGNMTLWVEYDGSIIKSKNEYEYDEDRNMTEYVENYEDGIVEYKEKNEYTNPIIVYKPKKK